MFNPLHFSLIFVRIRERERERERMYEGADKRKREPKRDAHLFDLYSIFKPCKGSWSDKKKSDFASYTFMREDKLFFQCPKSSACVKPYLCCYFSLSELYLL